MYTYYVTVSRYSDEDEFLSSYETTVTADSEDDLHFHMEHSIACCDRWVVTGRKLNRDY